MSSSLVHDKRTKTGIQKKTAALPSLVRPRARLFPINVTENVLVRYGQGNIAWRPTSGPGKEHNGPKSCNQGPSAEAGGITGGVAALWFRSICPFFASTQTVPGGEKSGKAQTKG